MLKIFGLRISQNVQKVLWLVGELDLNYELDLHGLEHGKNDQAPFFRNVPYAKQFLVDVKTFAR